MSHSWGGLENYCSGSALMVVKYCYITVLSYTAIQLVLLIVSDIQMLSVTRKKKVIYYVICNYLLCFILNLNFAFEVRFQKAITLSRKIHILPILKNHVFIKCHQEAKHFCGCFLAVIISCLCILSTAADEICLFYIRCSLATKRGSERCRLLLYLWYWRD